MINNLQDGSGKIFLRFEEINSWIGIYDVASQQKEQGDRRFRYLDNSCGICMSNYLPTDQIIVLPCSHGLHKHCFTSWSKNVCPFDSIGRVVKKVLFLRSSLTFTEHTREIVNYLQANQEKINNLLTEFFHSFQDKNPLTYQAIINNPEMLQLNDSLIEFFFQKLIDIYSHNDNISDAYVSECLQQLNYLGHRYAQLEKSLKNYHDIVLEKNSSQGDCYKLISFFNENLNSLEKIQFVLCTGFHLMGFKINEQGIDNLAFFLNKLGNTVVKHEEFIKLTEEADLRFLTKHFKVIRNLSCEKARNLYLSSMDSDNLQRLSRLTTGGGPTSLAIRHHIEKIKRKEDQRKLVCQKLCNTVIVVTLLALGIFVSIDLINPGY